MFQCYLITWFFIKKCSIVFFIQDKTIWSKHSLPHIYLALLSTNQLMLLLKFVSATFLLVCYLCLRVNTCETRKNVFYFTLKALFVLEIIRFKLFRYSNVMTSSNAQAWNTKHILLNNLGNKHSLVMKFGQFM